MYIDPWGLKISAANDGLRRNTTHNAEEVLKQIIKITGDSGYYLDGYNIAYKEGDSVDGGTEVGRALVRALMESDATICISLNAKGTDPHSSGYAGRRINMGSRIDSDELTATLVHELTHAYTDTYGLDDMIIYNFANPDDPNKIDIERYVTKKYQEATAITVEEEFRAGMNYVARSMITSGNIGMDGYGQFPYLLTNTSGYTHKIDGIGEIQLYNRVTASTLKVNGSGIVEFLTTVYGY